MLSRQHRLRDREGANPWRKILFCCTEKRIWKCLLPYKCRGSLEVEAYLHVYLYRRTSLYSRPLMLSFLQLSNNCMKTIEICRNYSNQHPDAAENIHCISKSLTLPIGYNMNNYTSAIRSYGLLYWFCTRHPALYKIWQYSSHKRSYRQLIKSICPFKKLSILECKKRINSSTENQRPHKATNKLQSLQSCKKRLGVCQPSFRGCRYLLPAPLKERDALLHLKCNHCKTLHTHSPKKPQKQLPQTSFHQEQTGGTEKHIWSLCGQAGPSSAAKEPKPIQLCYSAKWGKGRDIKRTTADG